METGSAPASARLAERERLFQSHFGAGEPLVPDLEWYASLPSTMDLARTRAEDGVAEGYVVAADEQTAGRGQRGSDWYSPGGEGLWFSLVLRPRQPVAEAARLTLEMAEALCEVLRQELGLVEVRVKHPNDVLLAGRKVSGILAEAATTSGRPRLDHLVMGVGVNLHTRFPPGLADIATSLAEHSKDVPAAPVLLASLLRTFLHRYGPY